MSMGGLDLRVKYPQLFSLFFFPLGILFSFFAFPSYLCVPSFLFSYWTFLGLFLGPSNCSILLKSLIELSLVSRLVGLEKGLTFFFLHSSSCREDVPVHWLSQLHHSTPLNTRPPRFSHPSLPQALPDTAIVPLRQSPCGLPSNRFPSTTIQRRLDLGFFCALNVTYFTRTLTSKDCFSPFNTICA